MPLTLTGEGVSTGFTDLEKIEDNVALLAFKTQVNGSLAKYSLKDQVVDEFVDATGIDASASTNEQRASGTYFGISSGANYPTGGTITDHGDYKVHSFLILLRLLTHRRS